MNEYENAKLYFDEGVKFYQNKDYENAKKSFLQCLNYAPKSQPALENLSKTFIELGLLDEAEKKLIYLISLNKKNDEQAYKLLFKIYALQNDYFKQEKLSKEAI